MSQRVLDNNDYISIERNPISREGIFPYLGKSIGLEPPDRIFQVYRSAEELSDPEAIKSFQTIPIIDDHEMLGSPEKGYVAPETKGMHGATGDSIVFENGVLYANIKIFSQTLQKLLEQGKRDLSLGYRAVYEKASGFYNGQPYDYIQRRLRGNHLALVDEGRNAVAVLDSQITLDHFDLTLDNKELPMADETAAAETEETKAGEPTIAECMAMLKKLMPLLDIADKLKAKAETVEEVAAETVTEDEDDKDKKDKDEKDTKDADDKEKEKNVMDSAEVKRRLSALESQDPVKAAVADINARNLLAARLSNVIGTFDHADKTKAEVVAYGCDKLGIKAPKGVEDVALNAYLDGRAQTHSAFALDAKDKPKSAELDAYLAPKKN